MPLVRGKSKEAFEHNLKTEIKAGKPMKQSLAISYAMKKKKKMAQGGSVPEVNKENAKKIEKGATQPGWKTKTGGGLDNFKRELGFMSEGGSVKKKHKKPIDQSEYDAGYGVQPTIKGHENRGVSNAGHAVRYGKDYKEAKEEHEQTLHEMRGMKKPNLYAEGGQIKDNYQSSSTAMHQDRFKKIDEKASGYVDHMGNDLKRDEAALYESDKLLNQHGELEQGPYGTHYADGGEVGQPIKKAKPESEFHATAEDFRKAGMRMRGQNPDEEEQKPQYADGGQIMDNYQPTAHEMDMVGHIMKKIQHHYSQGGKVSNGGEDELSHMADSKPNNFDDLSLRDDLESSYTGANSGDELDNEQEDHDRADIVSRIMRSRAKKDRLPNPR